MANGNSSKSGGTIVLTAAISGLLSAGLMFIGVWFTAVEGAGEEYLQDRQFILSSINRYDSLIALAETSTQSYRSDRQFILDSLQRHNEAIDSLQADRFQQGIAVAEIRTDMRQIRAILERLERRRGLD